MIHLFEMNNLLFYLYAPECVLVCLSVFLLTYEIPFPVGYVGRDVHVHHLQVQQPAVVGPGAKLQVTLLHIEWEPAYIDVAGALQDACTEVLG